MWRIPTCFPPALLTLLAVCPIAHSADRYPQPWIGVHVGVNNSKDVERLEKAIPALGKMGVNAIVIEVNYSFQFKSHPELHPDGGGITAGQARALADLCRANGIRPIPQLNCLGHQSWAKHTGVLLAAHPELDETPGKYPDNKGIYCRSWCPLNPETNRIVFPLVDELIDAFQADAFHVGMDEVFILGDADCPRCKGHDHAELFATQVNALHDHLVRERKVEMFMWADRLL
ncbi:MAG TPA: family 20 glycosylhydrolase, partial [Tepidisphaeraceae bacterium]